MKLLLAISLMFLFSNQTYSQECKGETVRLDSSGGSMEHVNLINQFDLGICYAATAAQMAAAAHGTAGFCPLSMAADLTSDREDQAVGNANALEFSDLCPAINTANREGYCPDCGPFYEALNRHDGGNEFFDRLNEYFTQFRDEHTPRRAREWATVMDDTTVSDFRNNICAIAVDDVRPTINLPSTEILIASLRDNNPGLLFGSLLERACTPRAPAAGESTLTCRNNTFPTREEAQNRLRGHFTANTAMPLGITYCSNVFQSTNPSAFVSHPPNPSENNRLYAYRNYNTDSERLRFMLGQFDSRILSNVDEVIAGVAPPSAGDTAATARHQAIMTYLNSLRGCLAERRDHYAAHPRAAATTSTFFSDGEMVRHPLTTILIGAYETDACRNIRETREALVPADDPVWAPINEAVMDVFRHNESEASLERSCGGHLSVVIGHRCLNGQHQYLIRNTWGQDCDDYSNEEGTGSMECEASTSSIWVDEDIMINNTVDYMTVN